MAALMLIRPTAAGEWTWTPAVGDHDQAGRGSPLDAARAASGHRVVVLVPGVEVSLTLVDVPVRNRGDAVAAIPWALEERLIDDVETLHFAVGTRTADDPWPVAIVSRTDIERLLAECAEAGLEPHVLLPEPLALPVPGDDAWTALEEADRVTVRTGADSGFACEPGMLSIVLAGEDPPGHMTRYCTADAPESQWPESFAAVLARADRVQCHEPVTAFSDASNPRLNLLQGAYARSRRHVQQLRRWLLPAGLAAGVAALALAQATIEHFALVERESQLRAQMERIYREAFPDAQRVVDPRAQMEGQLRALQGGENGETDFMEAIARVARPLAGNDDIRLTELEWRDGTLDLSLRTNRLDQLDHMQQALVQAGFKAELRGVDRDEDRVVGRIRLNGTRE